MKVRIYHYDMSVRENVLNLGMDPSPFAVSKAWQEGKYGLEHEYEFNTIDSDMAALALAYHLAQDCGLTRSTSVGDVMVINGQGFFVAPVGFDVVTL